MEYVGVGGLFVERGIPLSDATAISELAKLCSGLACISLERRNQAIPYDCNKEHCYLVRNHSALNPSAPYVLHTLLVHTTGEVQLLFLAPCAHCTFQFEVVGVAQGDAIEI
jgi:hypothetical protein